MLRSFSGGILALPDKLLFCLTTLLTYTTAYRSQAVFFESALVAMRIRKRILQFGSGYEIQACRCTRNSVADPDQGSGAFF
jgi:hypothetical protein